MHTLLNYTKKLIMAAALCIAAQQANAQAIQYADVADTTIDTWDVYSIWGGCDIWFHPDPEVVLRTKGVQVMVDDDGLPMALEAGDMIDATGQWDSVSYACMNCKATSGNWIGAEDKYLAIRKKNGSKWNYAWVLMDVAANARSFTIKAYALNTHTDEALKAGQVFATGITYAQQQDEVNVTAYNKTISIRTKDAKGSIAVNDMTGRLLKMVKLEQNLHSIDMSSYPEGIYTVTVRSIKGTKAFKIGL